MARKQLEAELGTSCCSFGGVCCLYTAVLVSPVQSPAFTETQSYVHRCLSEPMFSWRTADDLRKVKMVLMKLLKGFMNPYLIR